MLASTYNIDSKVLVTGDCSGVLQGVPYSSLRTKWLIY